MNNRISHARARIDPVRSFLPAERFAAGFFTAFFVSLPLVASLAFTGLSIWRDWHCAKGRNGLENNQFSNL